MKQEKVEQMQHVVKIYFSYAPEDELLVRELEKHLSPLKRAGFIEVVPDRNTYLDDGWMDESEAQISEAEIILLFLSPDFINSNYCYSVEMMRALKRHEEEKVPILTIILRPVYWKDTPLGSLPVLPTGEKPVILWSQLDEAFASVILGIRRVIEEVGQYILSHPQIQVLTPEQVISSLPSVVQEAINRKDTGAFKQGLEQYYEAHPDERLVVRGDVILYCEQFVQVAYAWQCWKMLTESLSSHRSMPPNILEEIVRLLSASLLPTTRTEVVLRDADAFHWTSLDTSRIFSNTRISNRLPVILYNGVSFNENTPTELRLLLRKITPGYQVALLLLFLESEHLDHALKILSTLVHSVYACDIIPLVCTDFLRIIDAKAPTKAFRRYILSRVDLKIISPFIIDGPTPDSMFFGREHELRTIRERIGLSNYVLIGGRRIGKTSILKCLVSTGLREAGFRTLFHDCSYTPSEADLVQALLFDKSWFPTQLDHQPSSFIGVIQALPDEPLVVLLDEFDKLIASDQTAGYPLLRALRSLANANRCHFVFSGEYFLRSELQNPRSPLYNLASELLIGNLDFRSVRELVVRPMKELEIDLVDEENMARRIMSFTSGHPNIVQRLCWRLMAKLNRGLQPHLGIEDIEEVIANVDFLRKDFLDIYWERATELERLCSLVMARDTSIRTLTTVHNALLQLRLHSMLNTVHDALERLVDLRNILHRTRDGYDFAVTAFPEVVSKTSRLDDLIALICERYKYNEDEAYTKRGEL